MKSASISCTANPDAYPKRHEKTRPCHGHLKRLDWLASMGLMLERLVNSTLCEQIGILTRSVRDIQAGERA